MGSREVFSEEETSKMGLEAPGDISQGHGRGSTGVFQIERTAFWKLTRMKQQDTYCKREESLGSRLNKISRGPERGEARPVGGFRRWRTYGLHPEVSEKHCRICHGEEGNGIHFVNNHSGCCVENGLYGAKSGTCYKNPNGNWWGLELGQKQ